MLDNFFKKNVQFSTWKKNTCCVSRVSLLQVLSPSNLFFNSDCLPKKIPKNPQKSRDFCQICWTLGIPQRGLLSGSGLEKSRGKMRFGMVGKSGDLFICEISTVANHDFGGKHRENQKKSSIMKTLIFGTLPFLEGETHPRWQGGENARFLNHPQIFCPSLKWCQNLESQKWKVNMVRSISPTS